MIRHFKTWARQLKRDGVTLWFACRHPETPWLAKSIAWLAVAYALSPIDLIPDFIPVLGFLDDMILLPCLIWLAARFIPVEIMRDCREQADAWMAKHGQKPRTAWGLALVGVIWLLFAWGIWRLWLGGGLR